ncbi:MAG TPA: O-antigen ligase family protein [Pseudolabrys sp.]|nr:O-antigen ligase family protein [Pseudolabrys sp.]
MIAARDIALPGRSVPVPMTASLAERILLIVLYVTMLTSSIAFVEPSPHDFFVGLVAVACLAAGVRFQRPIALLFLLLLIWNVAGLMALLNVPGREQTIQFTATSIYLFLAAVIFACVLSQNTMSRLAAMRTAYIASAVFTALAGIAGYFHAFPGAFDLFTQNDRAMGTFKDPNVYAPYLIWPALIIMSRIVLQRVRLRDLVLLGILLVGLLLSFSRGAWVVFGIAAAISFGIFMVTTPTPRMRFRIICYCAVGFAVLAAFVAVLLSIDSVKEMFEIRAHAIQFYDVGQGGRFRLQELAVSALLKFPNGMGPFEFGHVHGQQQHNVYLQGFLVYGWVGGIAYILAVLATLAVAWRSMFDSTPWQPYLVTAFAAFTGNALEGAVVDTDHWRHFFLLMGVVWGLYAATLKHRRAQAAPFAASVAAPQAI